VAKPRSMRESLPALTRFGKYFAPILARQRTLIAGSFLALFAEVLLRVLEPWPLKFIIDELVIPSTRDGHVSLPGLGSVTPTVLLTLAALAVVAIAGARALAAYGNTVGFALVGNRLLTEVRDLLYSHLQLLSLSFHNKARSGDLIVRVIGDVGLLKEVTVTALLPLLGNLFVLVGMLGVMFWVNWQLALLVLAVAPLFFSSARRRTREIQHASRRQRKQESAMANTAAESIGAIKVVQALSLNDSFAEVFTSNNQHSLKEGVQAKRLAARLERTVDVLIALATALVLWFGSRLVLRHELTAGELLVFLAYLKAAFKPVRNFAKHAGRLARASASGERVLEVLEAEPDVYDLPGAVEAPSFQGRVRFEKVGFAYEPGHTVLHDVTVDIHPGQQVALVGESGSGKSTLAGLLLRLYDPTEGRVTIDGRDIRDYTLASLRGQIAVVLQDSLLFAATIRDNIAYGASDATDAEIQAAARLANAHDFVEALPDGYDTVVGERGVTLSAGQRQRIAVARAAVRKSPILILDEPATGLDEENERLLIEALERLSAGRTTLLITHNLEHAQRCDRVFLVGSSRVAESTTGASTATASPSLAAQVEIGLGQGTASHATAG